ncbi:hypothetical protein Focb16_v004952 [Fusarium oxysporum f. sp. cubense]|uniref:Uncharacterized protein n=1 Tax=Fusarium oxysporum f. sp. cubense TaxID=61366 RepID=A0A559LIW1_FUSOC|nr:hypothetical protein Focb16_v004952 [Fusarium oxysporum f. sp. cubense]
MNLVIVVGSPFTRRRIQAKHALPPGLANVDTRTDRSLHPRVLVPNNSDEQLLRNTYSLVRHDDRKRRLDGLVMGDATLPSGSFEHFTNDAVAGQP